MDTAKARWNPILVILLVLGAGGCRPDTPQLPVSPVIMAAILRHFTDEKKSFKLRQRKLNPNDPVSLRDTIDHHKGFFIQARAQNLGFEHADWITEPSQPRMRARLETDLAAVESYVTTKLGTAKTPGPLGGPTEPGSPARRAKSQEYVAAGNKHLDLTDVSFTKTNTSEKEANQRRTTLLTDRIRRVHGIVWRAAGLHRELWDASGAIVTSALDEVLDRRLRAVERMSAQVSSRPALGGGGLNAPAGTPQGPWLDGFRVRPFEYPRITEKLAQVKAAIGAANILPPGSPAFQGDKPWLLDNQGRRLLYNVPPAPGLYLEPTELRQHWTQDTGAGSKDTYALHLAPVAPTTPAVVIDLLYRGRFDWWKRTWMYCDHVVSSLHIEALLFGLRRRNSNDNEFNQLAQDDYVQLSAFVGSRDTSRLMSDGDDDKYFENLELNERILEIGDQIIFWNSFLYAYLIRNEWRLENALIVDIESDGIEGRVVRRAIKLQGHGIPATRYDKYQVNLAGDLNELFSAVRDEAKIKPSTENSFLWHATGASIVRWDPFKKFASPGAWWIGLKTGDSGAPSHWHRPSDIKADLVRAIVKDDVKDDAASTPLEDFPSGFDALFPLYEPKVASVPKGSSAWAQHLKSSATAVPRSLAPVRAGPAEIPGFYLGGIGKPIDGVRVRVRP